MAKIGFKLKILIDFTQYFSLEVLHDFNIYMYKAYIKTGLLESVVKHDVKPRRLQ